jgi:hypothetical protein
MSSLYLPRGKPFNKYSVLAYQKKLLEEHCPFLTCSIFRNVLTCTGEISHPDWKRSYRIKIECVAGKEPKSTILSPDIDPCREIHMYPDHSLCLHYPQDMPWNEKTKLFKYTVPWITEWILYYELYLVNGGKWEGPESPEHFKLTDMNLNTDSDD